MRPLARLLFEQGGRCFFCEQPLPTTDASVEHLVASSNGGRDQNDNCVACCKTLNGVLGNKSLKEKLKILMSQKGQFQCPNRVQANVKKTESQKATKSPVNRYNQLVKNLKSRGKAKPGTVTKLKNSIATQFQNKLSPAEVEALVKQLETRKVICIDGSKVIYT